MLGRRRVFTLQPLGRQAWDRKHLLQRAPFSPSWQPRPSNQDGGCEEPLGGCVVLGAKSIYLRVHDMPRVASAEPQDDDCMVRGSREQASRDSGVEMGGGESPPTTPPGFDLGSSSLELSGRPKLASVTMEPPADLDRFLASQKLEQVVARSLWPRSSSTTVPKYRKHRKRSEQGPEASPEISGDQSGAAEAEVGSQLSPAESLVVGSESDAWACLPGQGLRYLEHLCLMLERMALLQQFHLQLQEQCQQMPTGQEEKNENSGLVPFHPRSSSMLGLQEFQNPVEKTVEESALPRRAEVHSVSTPNLLEAPAGAAHTIPSYRGHRNTLSHWNKVKALINRIRWKSPHASESSVAQDPPFPQERFRGTPRRSPALPSTEGLYAKFGGKEASSQELLSLLNRPTCQSPFFSVPGTSWVGQHPFNATAFTWAYAVPCHD
uniref:Uncharacterized protein C8orf58 homolog isoform X2 n=1 Tax=Phascolarctos cinereus TaxID=38626 RepID=A0A6P5JDE4_PHACI|nr:uncharacterized protein C8orf58 homolog isoform X2 [Phascolarctos cinereus]